MFPLTYADHQYWSYRFFEALSAAITNARQRFGREDGQAVSCSGRTLLEARHRDDKHPKKIWARYKINFIKMDRRW